MIKMWNMSQIPELQLIKEECISEYKANSQDLSDDVSEDAIWSPNMLYLEAFLTKVHHEAGRIILFDPSY